VIDTDSAATAGIEERLDRVVRLLAALVTKDMSRKDQILTLSGIGLQPREIAGILGISPNQASVTIYDAKQAAKAPAKKATKG
jgi:DNA-directed RNA polymerase specialized sigma24 family protein